MFGNLIAMSNSLRSTYQQEPSVFECALKVAFEPVFERESIAWIMEEAGEPESFNRKKIIDTSDRMPDSVPGAAGLQIVDEIRSGHDKPGKLGDANGLAMIAKIPPALPGWKELSQHEAKRAGPKNPHGLSDHRDFGVRGDIYQEFTNKFDELEAHERGIRYAGRVTLEEAFLQRWHVQELLGEGSVYRVFKTTPFVDPADTNAGIV